VKLLPLRLLGLMTGSWTPLAAVEPHDCCAADDGGCLAHEATLVTVASRNTTLVPSTAASRVSCFSRDVATPRMSGTCADWHVTSSTRLATAPQTNEWQAGALISSWSSSQAICGYTDKEDCRLPNRARTADAYRPACSPRGAPGPGGSAISPRAACLPHRSQRRSGPMLPPQPAWRVSRGGPPGVG
jgi:hypothetical protein